MRFKVSLAREPVHKSSVTCVGWSNAEEVYSSGDDNQLLSWKVSTNEASIVTQFKDEILPTDMHFMPKVGSNVGKQSDLLLLTSADGRFLIMNRSGRIERNIEAHKGAVLVGQWSQDGSGLMTGGEDGLIKIWSRGGMLRSTLVASENSIYGACWSPDSQAIAYTQGQFIVVKHLTPNSNPQKWKAHEGLVLCLAWSSVTDYIVSGGEDCRFRVWDSQGRPLFTSSPHDNAITAISWSPNGDMFAVGAFNTLRLCDFSGWSRSLEKPTTGCIYKLTWSNDGTQISGACANGQVLFAHIIQRNVSYINYTATITEQKTVVVKDILNDTTDYLELPERVIHMQLRYSHLILTTPTQCHIYNKNNWNTPTIFDLKDGSVILIQACEKHFLLVEKTNVGLYNYHGKLIASPRWPNMRLDNLRNDQITISPDTLCVRDLADAKTLHVVDLSSNRSVGDSVTSIQHTMHITSLALDQPGPVQSRNLLILDKARDLYLVPVRSTFKTFKKLGGQIHSFLWHSEESMIAAIQDIKLIVWYCPQASFDQPLLKLCSFNYEGTELGRSPRISDFVGNSVQIRRADGALVDVVISPFPSILHKLIQDNKWNEALNICRTVNEKNCWACLATFASQNSSDLLDIAEEAYSEINFYDKVFFIRQIKEMPTKPQHLAGAALLGGNVQMAESILLKNGMVYFAINNHMTMHNWIRALELAVKHKTHVDTVLYERQKYLKKLGKEEQNEAFFNLYRTIEIDKDKIEQKVLLEHEKYNKQN